MRVWLFQDRCLMGSQAVWEHAPGQACRRFRREVFGYFEYAPTVSYSCCYIAPTNSAGASELNNIALEGLVTQKNIEALNYAVLYLIECDLMPLDTPHCRPAQDCRRGQFGIVVANHRMRKHQSQTKLSEKELRLHHWFGPSSSSSICLQMADARLQPPRRRTR